MQEPNTSSARHSGESVNHNSSDTESLEEKSQRHAAVGDERGNDGDFIGALKEYQKAARLDPSSPQRLAKLAEGYAAADRPQKALDFYRRALEAQNEQDEDLPETHIGLGDLCCTFAFSAAAVRSYERAVRARPRKPFYRWKLAVALAALGLYDQAEQQLLVALELAPTDTYYPFQLADVYLLMQRESDAITYLKRVVELAPRDEYYRLRLGAALLRAERTGEAVAHFEHVAQLQPQNASYQTLLIYAYMRNDQEPAISVDIEMLELGPYDEDFVRRIQRMSQPIAA